MDQLHSHNVALSSLQEETIPPVRTSESRKRRLPRGGFNDELGVVLFAGWPPPQEIQLTRDPHCLIATVLETFDVALRAHSISRIEVFCSLLWRVSREADGVKADDESLGGVNRASRNCA